MLQIYALILKTNLLLLPVRGGFNDVITLFEKKIGLLRELGGAKKPMSAGSAVCWSIITNVVCRFGCLCSWKMISAEEKATRRSRKTEITFGRKL